MFKVFFISHLWICHHAYTQTDIISHTYIIQNRSIFHKKFVCAIFSWYFFHKDFSFFYVFLMKYNLYNIKMQHKWNFYIMLSWEARTTTEKKFVLRNLFLREENVHLKKTIKYNPSLDQTFLQKLRSFKVYFLKESSFFVVILPLVANYIFSSFIKELSKYDILV